MAARVMKPTAKTKIPVKALGSVAVPKKRATKVAIASKVKEVPQKQKATIVKLTKSREPKDTRILITNNTQKTKVPTPTISEKVVKKSIKSSKVVSTAVLPKPAILSPFRFPILSESRLPMIARVMGFVFIFVGAFLSLLNAPGSSDAVLSFVGKSHIATTIEPLSTTTNQTTTLDTTAPEPNISIEGVSPLSGTVPITIGVPNASSVKVILDNRDSNQLIVLGSAIRIDDSTWRIYWQTTQFSDAEYRIKVVVTGHYETYDYTKSDTYQVQNTIPEVPVTDGDVVDAGAVDTTGSQTATQSTDTSVGLLTSKTGTIYGGMQFKIFVTDATKVTMHARNTQSGALYYIGQTAHKAESEWRLDWSSELIPDATYIFFARAMVDGRVFESAHQRLTVANDDTLDSASTTEEFVPEEEVLAPSVSLSFSEASPFSGFVQLIVNTTPVTWVELYATPKNSLTTHFLGLATKRSDTGWTYAWDTSQTPNGTYILHTRVKSAYGFTEGARVEVKVLNQIVEAFTPEQEETVDALQAIAADLLIPTEEVVLEIPPDNAVYIEPVETFTTAIDTDDDSRSEIRKILNTYRTTLEGHLDALARAERAGDVEAVRVAKSDIETLKNELMNSLPASFQKKELIDQINTYLSQITFELQELTLRNENILKDRVGDAIINDSDKDGISDYDEVNLYNTNPFAADTDGDGFIDSAEITLGYNPHNSAPEALVAYQSPKETGILRDDILTIDTLTTLTTNTEGDSVKAFISGTGLPNSFVTLYVFSTPIVVTVKTGSDGSWNYIFDKELENGEHEVYIGITDNVGNVVAKSNPLPFVKTAEAFTKADSMSAALEAQNAQPSLLDDRSMLFVGALAVVTLGLVLLLLGVHVRTKIVVDAIQAV